MVAEIANSNYYNNSGIRMVEEENHQLMEGLEDDCTDSLLVNYVRDALKSVALGDKDNYSELVSLLHNKRRVQPEEVALLVASLKAISGAVIYIDAEYHDSLLTSIFTMSMWNYGPEVMDALIELITSLAASNGKYVDACLDMLVCNFTPPRSFLETLKLPYGSVKKEQVLGRVHTAFEHVTGLYPLAPSRLLENVTKMRMPRAVQQTQVSEVVMFVENLFKLENSAIRKYVGSRELLHAVVDLMLDFDVNVDWHDLVEENPVKSIFDMELEDELLLDDIEEDEDEFTRGSFGHKRVWKDEVCDKMEKLDSVMVLFFEHLKLCKNSGRLVEVFESLLPKFETTILRAYKSKFTQFVMFYACSLDPENCGVRFAEFLADFFFCGGAWRMSAVSYLSSYLARARFLSTSFITNMLERLVLWCFDYCGAKRGHVCPEADKVFYAVSQAIMYVLCFHMRSIMDTPQLKSQLSNWPLRQILKNYLVPLKVCLPSIVEEFVEQANSVHLLDRSGTPVIHDMLESELSKAFGGIDRLDMFFPFDPCLLRKSDSYIRPNFTYWSMVRKTYEAIEEDLESSSDDEVDVFYPGANRTDPQDVDLGISKSYEEDDDYLGDFNDSLNKMSITPKDSLLRKSMGEMRNAMQMPSRLRPSMSPESL